jgi:hypothetical protein
LHAPSARLVSAHGDRVCSCGDLVRTYADPVSADRDFVRAYAELVRVDTEFVLTFSGAEAASATAATSATFLPGDAGMGATPE